MKKTPPFHSILRLGMKMLICITIPLLVIWGLKNVYFKHLSFSHNMYLASIIDKQHLLDSVPSPRIVLMSGSCMAFGINSDILEKEFEIPVVNMALHYNLGSRFMMNQLKQNIRKGDIIIICLEYNILSEGEPEEQYIAAEFYQPASQWVAGKTKKEKVLRYFAHCLNASHLLLGYCLGKHDEVPTVNDSTSIFYRNCFSAKGDMIGHLNNPSYLLQALPINRNNVDFREPIKDVNEFVEFAEQKGAKVLYTFPSYCQSNFEENRHRIHFIENQLRAKLKCTIVGQPESGVMDDKLFFDNIYHPNAEGRKIWTYRLVEALQYIL